MSDRMLRVALVDGEMYAPLYDQLSQFSAETGIPVDVVSQLYQPDLIAHLREELPAGEAHYGLVSAYSQYTAGLSKYLLPLDDLLPPGELDDFSEEALDLCRWEGMLYQLPRALETRLLFYRSDIFEDRKERRWFAEATDGRELRPPQTWDELAAVAQYFTREGRMFGFAFPGRDSGLVATFAEVLTSVGGTFFDAEGQPRFFSRAGEWALALLRDLYARWQAVPPEITDCHYEEVSEMFRLGQCAMICDFPGTARRMCDPTFSAVAGWHSVGLMPGGSQGRRAAWTGCPTFAIPKSCPDPDAALALLRFLTRGEAQLSEARHGAIPSRNSSREEERDRLRLGTLGHLRFTLAEQTLRVAPLTAPAIPKYAEAEAVLASQLQAALAGECEVVPALEQAYLEISRLLSAE